MIAVSLYRSKALSWPIVIDHQMPCLLVQTPPYMAFGVGTVNYLQLRGSVGVAMRMQHGVVTVGQLHRDLAEGRREEADEVERRGQVHRVADRAWAFMRAIRGTAAYWASTGQDLHAMIRALGPPTFFFTLSANELGWDDMQLAVAPAHLNLTTPQQRQEYLAGLTPCVYLRA